MLLSTILLAFLVAFLIGMLFAGYKLYTYLYPGSTYTYVDLKHSPSIPPDPGKEKGNATLLGIDSDGDGVRDDVQRYLLANYSDNRPLRNVLSLSASYYLTILSIPLNSKDLLKIFKNHGGRSSCVSTLNGYTLNLGETIAPGKALKKVILNTPERRRDYLEKDQRAAGFYIAMPLNEITKENCSKLYGLEGLIP